MCPLLLRRKSMFDTLEPNSTSELEDHLEELAQHIALARRYVSSIDIPATPEEHAMKEIVKQDVPMLLTEILRLRPELRGRLEMGRDGLEKSARTEIPSA